MANMFDAAKSKLLNKLKETKFLKVVRVRALQAHKHCSAGDARSAQLDMWC